MSEFDLIQHYFQRPFADSSHENVTLGIGDDCALLQIPSGYELAISMDTLVEKVHFFENSDPSLLAQRALRVCVSDLAAMGAEALGFTLGLTLPKRCTQWLEAFSSGLQKASQQFHLPLIGGDTTKGPLTITLQVHGATPMGRALRRSHAQLGDDIYVSGSLGDGAAALRLIQKRLTATSEHALSYFHERFYCPDISMTFASAARSCIHSAIDISDGLLADLNHILVASNLGASLDVDQLPIAPEMAQLVDPHSDLPISQNTHYQWALTGGDDYRLCFTAPPHQRAALLAIAQKHQTTITRIGVINAESEINLQLNGKPIPQALFSDSQGYSHF